MLQPVPIGECFLPECSLHLACTQLPLQRSITACIPCADAFLLHLLQTVNTLVEPNKKLDQSLAEIGQILTKSETDLIDEMKQLDSRLVSYKKLVGVVPPTPIVVIHELMKQASAADNAFSIAWRRMIRFMRWACTIWPAMKLAIDDGNVKLAFGHKERYRTWTRISNIISERREHWERIILVKGPGREASFRWILGTLMCHDFERESIRDSRLETIFGSIIGNSRFRGGMMTDPDDAVKNKLRQTLCRSTKPSYDVLASVAADIYNELSVWCTPFTQEARDSLDPRDVQQGLDKGGDWDGEWMRKARMILDPMKTIVIALYIDDYEKNFSIIESIAQARRDFAADFREAATAGPRSSMQRDVRHVNRILYKGMASLYGFMEQARRKFVQSGVPCVRREPFDMFDVSWRHSNPGLLHMSEVENPETLLVRFEADKGGSGKKVPLRVVPKHVREHMLTSFSPAGVVYPAKVGGKGAAGGGAGAAPSMDERLHKKGVCTIGSREWRLMLAALCRFQETDHCVRAVSCFNDWGNHMAVCMMLVEYLAGSSVVGADGRNADSRRSLYGMLPKSAQLFTPQLEHLRKKFREALHASIRVSAALETIDGTRFSASDLILQLAVECVRGGKKMEKFKRFCPRFEEKVRENMDPKSEMYMQATRCMIQAWVQPGKEGDRLTFQSLVRTGKFMEVPGLEETSALLAPPCSEGLKQGSHARSMDARRRRRDRGKGGHEHANETGEASACSNEPDKSESREESSEPFVMYFPSLPAEYKENVKKHARKFRRIARAIYVMFEEDYSILIPLVYRARFDEGMPSGIVDWCD